MVQRTLSKSNIQIYIYACAYCWRVYSDGLHAGLLPTINTYNQQVVSSINHFSKNSTKVYMKPIGPAYTLLYYYAYYDWLTNTLRSS